MYYRVFRTAHMRDDGSYYYGIADRYNRIVDTRLTKNAAHEVCKQMEATRNYMHHSSPRASIKK